MTTPQKIRSMALFCDFENIALGVRDAKYEKFDICQRRFKTDTHLQRTPI